MILPFKKQSLILYKNLTVFTPRLYLMILISTQSILLGSLERDIQTSQLLTETKNLATLALQNFTYSKYTEAQS